MQAHEPLYSMFATLAPRTSVLLPTQNLYIPWGYETVVPSFTTKRQSTSTSREIYIWKSQQDLCWVWQTTRKFECLCEMTHTSYRSSCGIKSHGIQKKKESLCSKAKKKMDEPWSFVGCFNPFRPDTTYISSQVSRTGLNGLPLKCNYLQKAQ